MHAKGDKRDIFIFATRRGGSTWLSNVVCSQRGMRLVDQPFDPGTITDEQKAALPRANDYQYIHFSPADCSKIECYFRRIRAGNLPIRTRWHFLGRYPSTASRRLVYKIVNAKAMIGFFLETFDGHFVYLVRHPIPVSLSVIRNGWPLHVEAYLDNAFFVSRYLSSKQRSYAQQVMRTGSTLQKYILNWCLENIVPLKFAGCAGLLTVTYEELVLNKGDMLRMLRERLDLNAKSRMDRNYELPSSTSTFSTLQTLGMLTDRQALTAERKRHLVGDWKRGVSREDEADAYRVLEAMGIDAYHPEWLLPNRDLLLFETATQDEYERLGASAESQSPDSVP